MSYIEERKKKEIKKKKIIKTERQAEKAATRWNQSMSDCMRKTRYNLRIYRIIVMSQWEQLGTTNICTIYASVSVFT